MKYVALDIETTGLDPQKDQVLQIAFVIEDTENTESEVEDLPFFEALIYHERISGHPFALNMNAEIIEALSNNDALHTERGTIDFRGREAGLFGSLHYAITEAFDFLSKNHPYATPKMVAAGKNAAGFDLPFLGRPVQNAFHHRVIDVGNVALGANPLLWKEDHPPGLADLHDRPPTHDALEDARDVIRILRKIGGYC